MFAVFMCSQDVVWLSSSDMQLGGSIPPEILNRISADKNQWIINYMMTVEEFLIQSKQNLGTHQLICCPNLWVQWPIFEATSNLYCLWMLTVYAMKPRLQRKARNTPALKVFPTIYMQAFVSKDQVSNSYTNERPKWTNIHSTTNKVPVSSTPGVHWWQFSFC